VGIAPWQIVTDAKGFESIVESDEDGEPKGDLVCHVFGDHGALLLEAPALLKLLDLLTTRARMDIRLGTLPPEWGSDIILRARVAMARVRGGRA
jgi:hypothetical protein